MGGHGGRSRFDADGGWIDIVVRDGNRSVQGLLVGYHMLRGQKSAQLLECSRAPFRYMEWVVDAPEGVVGDAQDRGEAVSLGELHEQLDDRNEVGEMLDDLEGRHTSTRGVVGGQLSPNAVEVVRGCEVGLERAYRASVQLPRGLRQRSLGIVDQQYALGKPLAERVAGGNAVPAAEVPHNRSLRNKGGGKSVADLVLDPDGRVRVAGDALLPGGAGHHSSSATRGAFRSK